MSRLLVVAILLFTVVLLLEVDAKKKETGMFSILLNLTKNYCIQPVGPKHPLSSLVGFRAVCNGPNKTRIFPIQNLQHPKKILSFKLLFIKFQWGLQSRLKYYPGLPFTTGNELCSQNPGSFFQEQSPNPRIPGSPIPSPEMRIRSIFYFTGGEKLKRNVSEKTKRVVPKKNPNGKHKHQKRKGSLCLFLLLKTIKGK